MDLEVPTGQGAHQQHTEQKLLTGERALRTVRCRVSGTLLAASLVCTVARVTHVLQQWNDSGISWFGSAACVVLLGLVPLPNDLHFTRLALCIMVIDPIILLSIISVQLVRKPLCMHRTFHSPGAHCYSCQYLYASFQVGFILGVLGALLRRRTSAMQAIMWGSIQLYFLLEFLTDVSFILNDAICVGRMAANVWWLPGDLLGVFVAMCPTIRRRVHAWLGRLYEERGATAAAASVAALMSGSSAKAVLQEAAGRFRCIRVDQLTREDLITSPTQQSTPFNLERTVHCRLGQCDAFLSHSWHDNVEAKWQALQSWRATFIAENRREPRVWIDKLCIDQNDIEADLRGLPIFLSGCKELLVLCGPTYLSRLWCIMELFTFVQMGGDLTRIKLLRLLQDGQQERDKAAIQCASENFDARRCECLVAADKEKMLTIIMAAFGDVAGFNKAVCGLLKQASAGIPLAGRWSFEGSAGADPN